MHLMSNFTVSISFMFIKSCFFRSSRSKPMKSFKFLTTTYCPRMSWFAVIALAVVVTMLWERASSVSVLEGCSSNCNYNGMCIDGVCKCFEGWDGDECDRYTCKCANKGKVS